jgi:enterochelin esterase-like enzyme
MTSGKRWIGSTTCSLLTAVAALGIACSAETTGGTPNGSGGSAPVGSGGTISPPLGGQDGGRGGSGGATGTGGQVTPPVPDAEPPEAAAAETGGGDSAVMDPGSVGDGNSMINAPFMRAPETVVGANIPKGRVINFSLSGAASKVYPGNYMRPAAVYIPAGYVSGTEIPFMTAQDGLNFGYFPRLVTILDNMIADGKLPAMAVVGSNPTNQRSVEYDTVSDAFTRFVETELLPEAKRQAMTGANVDLNLTNDPEGRGSFGGSSGGSCAFVMGWFGNFRRILTVSGSFRPLQTSMMYPMGAAEFQNRLIANTPMKGFRAFLEAGSNDLGGWKVANDQVAAALGAKGYHYKYIFANGAGHTDGAAMNQYLPEAMLWVWRGYPIKK